MKRICTALSLSSIVLFTSMSMGAGECELKKLPADIDTAYYFGSSVSISGDTAVIGATGSDVDSFESAGAAYIYVRSGSKWINEVKLVSHPLRANSRFGASVAISGDTVVIGDHMASEAQIFVFDGSEWIYETTLSASTPTDSEFGSSVSIDGDTVLIGASGYDLNGVNSVGRVYAYQRTGTNWLLQSVLSPNNPEAGGRFGEAVDLDGDLAVVGALTNGGPFDVDSGSAYIFVRSGNIWQQEALLAPEDLDHGDYFGSSVAIDNGTVVVGAWMHDIPGEINHSGAAYVFARRPNVPATWQQMDKITSQETTSWAEFGWSVDILDNTILVGAKSNRGLDGGPGSPRPGSAHVFQKNNDESWSQIGKFYAEDGEEDDWFGYSVALGHGSAVVSTHYDIQQDPFIHHAGGAYFYCGDWIEDNNGTDCPGDSTGDNVVNVNDILAVINVWGNCLDCAEDVTGDGVINVDDVLLILSNFGLECP